MNRPPASISGVMAPIVWALGLAMVIAWVSPGQADIVFERRPLVVASLPAGFRATCGTTADTQGHGEDDLIVGGMWTVGRAYRSAAIVIRADGDDLKMVARLFERTVRADSDGTIVDPIAQLCSVDIDNDGRDDVFAIGPPSSDDHSMARWNGGTFEEQKPPFPALYALTLAWLDYDGDGWVDLYVSGGEPIPDRPAAMLSVVGRLYRNRQGRFEKTDITFGDDIVNSAHALDLDGDGKPDLLLTAASTVVRQPRFTRIWLNRGGCFEQATLPVRGQDELLGLDQASVAAGDLDGDGKAEFVMAGHWGAFVAKSTITLVYRQGRERPAGRFCLDYDYQRMTQLPDLTGRFRLADLDGDGDVDILAAGRGRDFRFRIVCLENVGGSLRPVTTGPWKSKPDQPLGAAWGWIVIPWDVNGDGLLDVVAFPEGAKGRPTLLLNRSKAK